MAVVAGRSTSSTNRRGIEEPRYSTRVETAFLRPEPTDPVEVEQDDDREDEPDSEDLYEPDEPGRWLPIRSVALADPEQPKDRSRPEGQDGGDDDEEDAGDGETGTNAPSRVGRRSGRGERRIDSWYGETDDGRSSDERGQRHGRFTRDR